MIRVLVAEDSPTARALLVHLLESDPEICVVGQAKDGVEAVAMTHALKPDLITMDIHMPRMNGLEATKEIMSTAPTPIIIVSGSTQAREIQSSMQMLRLGALDVLIKPPGPDTPGHQDAARQLVSIVKVMSQVKVVRHWRELEPPAEALPALAMCVARVRIVAIAASTGGPQALQRLLTDLPVGFAVPILVVQHITPGFTVGLSDWLNTVCAFHVKIAKAGEVPVPRSVYIAPDDRHLGVSPRGELTLSNAPPIGGFRPSGTYLFESVAKVYGASVAAVILTGMGEDGVGGLREVRRAGGRIIAQDEKSSVVFGMPAAAIAAGLPEVVLPLDVIAERLASMAR